jgi:hypothetical protein
MTTVPAICFASSAGLRRANPRLVGRIPKNTQPRKLCSKTWRDSALRTEVIAKAMRALEDPLCMKLFVDIAENVQIPFEALERTDIYLFD